MIIVFQLQLHCNVIIFYYIWAQITVNVMYYILAQVIEIFQFQLQIKIRFLFNTLNFEIMHFADISTNFQSVRNLLNSEYNNCLRFLCFALEDKMSTGWFCVKM